MNKQETPYQLPKKSKGVSVSADDPKEALLFSEMVDVDFELSIDKIAKNLANQHSEKQAEFFNQFADHLEKLCEGNNGCISMQYHYIADNLKENAKHMFYDIDNVLKER